MSLDMYGAIDPVFDSMIQVDLITSTLSIVDGIYSPDETVTALGAVNIQPATEQEVEQLSEGSTEPKDIRVIHINDGTMIYPNREDTPADILVFDVGTGLNRWKVIKSDCRPWRNFCLAYVEQMANG